MLVHYRAKLNFILACNPVGSIVDLACTLKRIVTFLLNQEIYISYSCTTYTVDHILSFYRYNLRVWDDNRLIFRSSRSVWSDVTQLVIKFRRRKLQISCHLSGLASASCHQLAWP